ncbi:MAG: hypothetical protein P9M15_01400, partial [Candidatus Electryoneaceae bacterium]|nr:hypothetical protein [Candidatus Electryoneaceae bacterium]
MTDNNGIETVRKEFETDANGVQDPQQLEQLRVKYLGRKGIVSATFDRIREIPPAERRDYGKNLNELKNHITARMDELTVAINAQTDSSDRVDMTMPGVSDFVGGLHPLTLVLDEVIDIF